MPRGTGDGNACPRESGQYGDVVALAQEYARGPECACVQGDDIVDSPRYHAFVVAYLERSGFCAFFDGEEIAIKKTNHFSEQWDIESARARVIRMYAATCRPAWSAIPPSGAPQPTPSPGPTPSPCVPETVTVPFDKCGHEPECWKCSERIAWDVAKGDWTPLPGAEGRLWYNHPGGDPNRWEYIDARCNYVRRDGSIIRTTEQQWGRACVDNQAICPETRTETRPCPSPTPGPLPTPQPGPTPTGPCPAIAGLGGQVAQFQLNHVTVGWHREQPADVYVANGPANKVNFDTTVYYGCAAPRCDSEHDHSLARCEDLRGQTWRVLSGPARNCQPTNGNGAEHEGRGFGYMCDVSPGAGEVEACTVQPWISTETGEHVRGSACKTIRWRVEQ